MLTAAVFGDRADEVRQSQIERKTVWNTVDFHRRENRRPLASNGIEFKLGWLQAFRRCRCHTAASCNPGGARGSVTGLHERQSSLEIDFEPIQIDVTSSPSVVPAHVQMAASRGRESSFDLTSYASPIPSGR